MLGSALRTLDAAAASKLTPGSSCLRPKDWEGKSLLDTYAARRAKLTKKHTLFQDSLQRKRHMQ